MGWCHEFGPQIVEGCDHPMVAGATSCTCQLCGAECKGRFSGCADVWARGPREVAVRVSTLAPQGVEELLDRLQALEARSSQPVRAPGHDELKNITERVRALESAPPAEPRVPASLVAQMELLMEKVARLEGTATRLMALERIPNRLVAVQQAVAALQANTAPADHTGRLEAMSAQLDRLTAEVAAPTTPPIEPEVMPRIKALDGVVAELVRAVNHLSSRVAALDEVPKRVDALEQASSPSEKLVASLGKRVDRLSTQAAALKELPEQVKALKQAVSGDGRVEQTTEQLGHIASDVSMVRSALDKLTHRVQALEDTPVAPEAPEQSPYRSEALASGLGHAIDMIDQLAHQVAVLEERFASQAH